MIAEAHRRIDENPRRYVDHVYGEHEAGGASYLILAGVSHRKLGLPSLPRHFRSSYAEPIMKSIPGLIIGLGLFLGGLYRMEGRRRAVEDERKERTGKEAGP
jgi:formate dehydrogenase iron-sulfur subunit